MRTNLAVVIDADDTFIKEALKDMLILLAFNGGSPGLLELLLEICRILDLHLHLGHLRCVLLFFLFPTSGHLLKHFDGVLLAPHAISLSCSVSHDFNLGAPSLRRRLHHVATGAMSSGSLSRCMKNLRDLWIHVDELVALDGDLGVPLVDAVIDPFLEGFANDAVDEVAEVAPLEP